MILVYKPLLTALDTRSKLLIILLLTVLVFLVNSLPIVVFLLLSFILFRLAAKIPFRSVKYFKNLSLLAAFIIVIQTVFYPGTHYMGGFSYLKWEGFIFGLIIACRLFALLILFPIFTETTSPHSLALALNALGLKYRIAFIITFSFNLIPVFKEEAITIMDAQKLRGMRSFEKKSFFFALKAYGALVVPLVLGAMRKAQISSVAMDSRAFGAYKTRTWLDKPRMKVYDFVIILICLIFSTCLLLLNYYNF